MWLKLVYTTSVTAPNEQTPQKLSKTELLARIVGNSLEHDQEDIRFWQTASEKERGETLYGLLQFAQNVVDSMPPRPAEPLTFPGFPKRRSNALSSLL